MVADMTSTKEAPVQLWNQLRTGLIVSCQASAGTAMDRPDFIAAQARTVEQAGAIAIRAEGIENIRAVLQAVKVPVIGLIKARRSDSEVFITPTVDHVLQLDELGVHIIAVDATARTRWNKQTLEEFYLEVRSRCSVQLLADIDTLENARHAAELGFDGIATTLSGYTKESQVQLPNIPLLAEIAAMTDRPLVAEGGFTTPEEVRQARAAGAWSVCVGTAITNPYLITQKFVAKI